MTTTRPTTTPAAIPTLLGPLDEAFFFAAAEEAAASAWPGAVTTMVWPASVITEGAAELVGVGLLEDDGPLELELSDDDDSE